MQIWTKRRAPHRGDAALAGLNGALEGHAESATEGWAGALELSGASTSVGAIGVLGSHDWDDLHAASGTVENTGYDGDSGFGALEFALGEGRALRLSATITRDHDVPRTDRLNAGFGQTQPANEEFDFALQDRERVVLAYTDEAVGARVGKLEARLTYRYYDEQRHIRATGSDTRRIERDTTETVGLGLDLRQEVGGGHLLTLGFDLDQDEVDSSRDDVDLSTGTVTPNDGAFAPGSRFLSGGVFAQDELVLGAYDVTLGARWNTFAFRFDDAASGTEEDGTFDALSGSLAVGRALGRDDRLVATLARGFRAPNLAELARDASFFGGDELHNPDLEPETSLYLELAWELSRPAWTAALAVFRNEIEDVVGSRLIDPGGPQPGDETYLRENIGELEVLGAFAHGSARLGGAASPWSARGSIEYTYGQQSSDFVDPLTGEKTFDDVPGQRIPPLHGWLALRHDLALGWLTWVELGTAWAFEQDRLSPQDLGDPRIDPDGTDGWITLDLDAGGPLGKRADSRWFVGMHNLLDEEYRIHGSGFDAPGIGLVVGARWSW